VGVLPDRQERREPRLPRGAFSLGTLLLVNDHGLSGENDVEGQDMKTKWYVFFRGFEASATEAACRRESRKLRFNFRG
jgi:hypothetical protein